MVKFVDSRTREEEILDLIAEHYIQESRPISSGYLCRKCRLNYSPATVRNVMVSLEKQGLLRHIHTSSGRVPTQRGFKSYVNRLREKEAKKRLNAVSNFCTLPNSDVGEVIDYTLDALVEASGYTSLMAVSGERKKIFFRGMRLILEQPEFGDIENLKHVFYALEVRMDEIQRLLFDCVAEEEIQILIGDDIGFAEISSCSLVASGLKNDQFTLALALLGPMRMNYARALACLNSVKGQLSGLIEELI